MLPNHLKNAAVQSTAQAVNSSETAFQIESFDLFQVSDSSAATATKKPAHKKNGLKMANHSSKVLVPTKAIESKRSKQPEEVFECSYDGVQMMDKSLDIYGKALLLPEEELICSKIGRKSLTRNSDGTLIECIVVKTNNAFALPIFDSDHEKTYLEWAMSRIDLVKKVKAVDGRVYVDVRVADEMDVKLVRIPISSFSDKGIKGLSKYNITLLSDYSMPMGIYLRKLADQLPMEDASQVIGAVKNPATEELSFNGYNRNAS